MKTKTRKRASQPEATRYPDSIKTDNLGMVRLRDLKPTDVLVVQGRKIQAQAVPLSNYHLECGHVGQGIAVTVGRAFYCDDCQDTKFVVKARS